MKLKLSHNVFAYCFIQYLLNNIFDPKFQGEKLYDCSKFDTSLYKFFITKI
jgi:hypothetical protein